MHEELICWRKDNTTNRPEPLTVRMKYILHLIKEIHSPLPQETMQHLKERLWNREHESIEMKHEVQDVLDAALLWLVMPHDPDEQSFLKPQQFNVTAQNLLELGANPSLFTKDGFTVLMMSCKHPEILEQLLRLTDYRKPDLDQTNQIGDTALILAVYNGHAYAERALIEAGANPLIRNNYNKKASMYAKDTYSATLLLKDEEHYLAKHPCRSQAALFSPW